jgi:hypothetical protein
MAKQERQPKYLKKDIARENAVAIIRVRFSSDEGGIVKPKTDNRSLYGTTN